MSTLCSAQTYIGGKKVQHALRARSMFPSSIKSSNRRDFVYIKTSKKSSIIVSLDDLAILRFQLFFQVFILAGRIYHFEGHFQLENDKKIVFFNCRKQQRFRHLFYSITFLREAAKIYFFEVAPIKKGGGAGPLRKITFLKFEKNTKKRMTT